MGKSDPSISPPPLLSPLLFLSPPPPPPSTSNFDSKISPSILLIIVILAIIFFVSGLLHLLVRCLLRPTTRIRDPAELDPDPTALQGQLRQLFHLHDGGVDQSFIDTLPVFPYKAIMGVKDPFDCAVCLCEFEAEDKLRLLPKCSHAFHVECIDTWLLSHSTCPLCRFSLLNGFNGVGGNGVNHVPFPFVCVLESSRDMGDSVPDSDPNVGVEGDVSLGLGLGLGSGRASDLGSEARGKEEGERIVTVKLGKFRNVDGGEGSSENNNVNNDNNDGNLGSRRCFSMGSFAYVLDETTSLQVPIRTPAKKKQTVKKPALPLKPGYSAAISEYGSDSTREFSRIEALKSIEFHNGSEKLHSHPENGNGNGSGRSKRESFSISKIWMRGDKGKKGNNDSSRRTISEIEIDDGCELGQSLRYGGGDEDTQSCRSVDSLANPRPSTSTSTKRTLLWLMGRNNKIVHNHSSSFSSNV